MSWVDRRISTFHQKKILQSLNSDNLYVLIHLDQINMLFALLNNTFNTVNPYLWMISYVL